MGDEHEQPSVYLLVSGPVSDKSYILDKLLGGYLYQQNFVMNGCGRILDLISENSITRCVLPLVHAKDDRRMTIHDVGRK